MYRTREQKNTLDPFWGESFILTLPKDDLSSLELRIEVLPLNCEVLVKDGLQHIILSGYGL